MGGFDFGDPAQEPLFLLNSQAGDSNVAALPGQNTEAAQALQKRDFGCVAHSLSAIFRQKAFEVKNEFDFCGVFAENLNHYE